MKGYTNALGPTKGVVLNTSNLVGSFAVDGANSANGALAIAIGNNTNASGANAIAIGTGANAYGDNAIQIGNGLNNDFNTLKVGFENGANFELLDGNTGLIPDDRISSAIARTVDVGQAEEEISALNSIVDTIGSMIPSTASDQNQLADKDFVNSSIATNTATFRGTFNSFLELESYSGEKDDNDYAFVRSVDSVGNTLYNRYKYNGTEWVFEYSLNNSSFTADQWAAINSNATANKINQISTNASNIANLESSKASKQELASAVSDLTAEIAEGSQDIDVIETEISDIQDTIGDTVLTTEEQTLTGAIEEVKGIADSAVNRTSIIKNWSDDVTARVNDPVVCNGSIELTGTWQSNQNSSTNSEYPYIYTFAPSCPIKFTTENDYNVSIAFEPAQVMSNNFASFCSFTASAIGNATNCAITLYAKEQPGSEITVKYSITRGNLTGYVENIEF